MSETVINDHQNCHHSCNYFSFASLVLISFNESLCQKSLTVTKEKEQKESKMRSERERAQGVAVLADKDVSISEQKRTCEPKQVIKSQKNGNRGMGILQLLTHHFRMNHQSVWQSVQPCQV